MHVSNTTADKPCKEFGDPGYCIAISVVNRFGGVLSVLSCLIVLTIIFILKRYNSVAQRLFIYLYIASVLSGLSFSLSGITLHGVDCMIDGSILHFAQWAVFVAICNITVNLCWNILFLRVSHKCIEVYFIAVNIIVPAIFTIVPWFTLSYGKAGQWCWISNEGSGRLLRFVVFYIPLFIILIATVIIYSILLIRLFLYVRKKKLIQSDSGLLLEQKLKKDIFALIWAPLAFILVWIIPLIHRITNLITQNDYIFSLAFLHALSASLMGFFISVFFFFDFHVLRELKWSNFKFSLLTLFTCRKPKSEIYALHNTELRCSFLEEKPVYASNKDMHYEKFV